MTYIDKKQLMAQIELLSESNIAKLAEFVQNLVVQEQSEDEEDKKFNELLEYTGKKYEKVWRALA